jgi:hypothetical protein
MKSGALNKGITCLRLLICGRQIRTKQDGHFRAGPTTGKLAKDGCAFERPARGHEAVEVETFKSRVFQKCNGALESRTVAVIENYDSVIFQSCYGARGA